MTKTLKAVVSYNGIVPSHIMSFIGLAWVVFFVIGWTGIAGPFIPGPLQMFSALKNYWFEGFAEDIHSSLITVAEGTLLSILIAFPLAYLSRVPLFRPLVEYIALTRFNGISGILIVFVIFLSGGHWLKVYIIVFGMMPYMLTSLASVVLSIPDETFDYAKTLRMGTFESVWEMVIIGQAYAAAEVVRQNFAMAWLMLTLVEGLVRSEGGLGKLLKDGEKFMNMANIYAIQFTIWSLGFLIVLSVGKLNRLIFKHEFIGRGK